MNNNILSVSIETLILVAVWQNPSIFQGCFTITDQQNSVIKYLYYRCESIFDNGKDILHNEFSPYHYRITNLYCKQNEINVNGDDDKIEQAVYLLKYALYLTLEQMLTRSKKQHAYMDEIVMTAFSKQIEQLIVEKKTEIANHEMGFAVAVDFTPNEENGKIALQTLLQFDN